MEINKRLSDHSCGVPSCSVVSIGSFIFIVLLDNKSLNYFLFLLFSSNQGVCLSVHNLRNLLQAPLEHCSMSRPWDPQLTQRQPGAIMRCVGKHKRDELTIGVQGHLLCFSQVLPAVTNDFLFQIPC